MLVRNESHLDPSEHEHLVTVADGVPGGCECPADGHFESACKHRVAVALRAPVPDAVTQSQVIADGVSPAPEPATGAIEGATGEGGACDCGLVADGFPCWSCVERGREPVPRTGKRRVVVAYVGRVPAGPGIL